MGRLILSDKYWGMEARRMDLTIPHFLCQQALTVYTHNHGVPLTFYLCPIPPSAKHSPSFISSRINQRIGTCTHTHMCTHAPYTHCMVLDISNGPFHTEFIHICNITPTHQTPNATLPLNDSFFFRFSDFHFNYCPLRPSTSVSVFSLQYLL